MIRVFMITLALSLIVGRCTADDSQTPARPTPSDTPKKSDAKKKGTQVAGKLKSVDAETGTIVLSIGRKGQESDRSFTIGNNVSFTIFIGSEKKDGIPAKEGLKSEHLKVGTAVILKVDGDKVVGVQIGQMPKKPKP